MIPSSILWRSRSEKPHREGGGETDVVIHFSIRPGSSELLYELLDNDLNPVGTVTFETLAELYRAKLPKA